MTNEQLDEKIKKIQAEIEDIKYINDKFDEIINYDENNKEEN